MRELSLHIIDIVENSIAAGATDIYIEIEENIKDNYLKLVIKDDGIGISEEMLDKVMDPFVTSRTTRRVGLGLPLLKAACERCGGELKIQSKNNQGTLVTATLQYNHIDRAPIGRISDSIVSLVLSTGINIKYCHIVGGKEFIFDTIEIKKIIGDSFSQPEVLNWIKDYINENLREIGANLWE